MRDKSDPTHQAWLVISENGYSQPVGAFFFFKKKKDVECICEEQFGGNRKEPHANL